MADERDEDDLDEREAKALAWRRGCFNDVVLINVVTLVFFGWLMWGLTNPKSAPLPNMTHADWLIKSRLYFWGSAQMALVIAGVLLPFNFVLCGATVEMRSWRGRSRWLSRAVGLTLVLLLGMLGVAWVASRQLVSHPPPYSYNPD